MTDDIHWLHYFKHLFIALLGRSVRTVMNIVWLPVGFIMKVPYCWKDILVNVWKKYFSEAILNFSIQIQILPAGH